MTSAPEFDIISLCNLAALYGFELDSVLDNQIFFRREGDVNKWGHSCRTYETWLKTFKHWSTFELNPPR